MEKIENLRDTQGFIDISNLKLVKIHPPATFFTYFDDRKYYFKVAYYDVKGFYNELIAEEIAKDFNIPCVHYDIAEYNGMKGVISENFMKNNDTYVPIKTILKDYFVNEQKLSKHNNLTDIWSAIDYRYKNPKITKEIMNQIVNVFLYDVLIANIDRHNNNFGLIENDNKVSLAPLFDNENMLAKLSLLYGGYSLGIDEQDYSFFEKDLEPDSKYLIKFLNESSIEYRELLQSKLWIIEDENIDKIIDRVEKRINRKIEEPIKNKFKEGFSIQLENIKYTLDYTERKL